MDLDLLSIGAFARASGLSVSALRFYDKAGVLVPAVVDAATGYRRYRPDQLHAARLVAGMRRITMPLMEIGVVLEQLSDRESVEQILADHLHRLEDGLTDARREVERLQTQLRRHDADESAPAVRVRLRADDLLRAIETVRHAVGTDPDFPVLTGILLEVEDDVCRLVATDRYRLALATAPILPGPADPVLSVASTSAVVPAAFAERARNLLAELGDDVSARSRASSDVLLVLAPEHVELEAASGSIGTTPLDGEFPDHRRLLHGVDGRAESLDLDTLHGDLASSPARGRHTDDGLVLIGRREEGLAILDAAPDEPSVAVNREFLLQAAESIPHAQVHLDLDGPIAPLVIRSTVDEHTLALLMPVRREP